MRKLLSELSLALRFTWSTSFPATAALPLFAIIKRLALFLLLRFLRCSGLLW